jgi:FMN-dependent oxidoreductase (nitrilotriacetate monooxygenase family)
MAARPFHLGWFMSFRPPAWNTPFSGNDGLTWANGDYYVNFISALERAKFDYMMIEDSSMVSDAYAGTSEIDLKHALYAPKHDPVPLVPVLARATSRIGIVATMSTSFYPPFMLARTMTTLDHISRGRVGWNIVTSSEDRAAQNYGLDKLYPHDERYDRADEFFDVVTKLWDSWEPDALVMDKVTGKYVDHTKIHPIDHDGKYFKVRGPMNTLRSPQGRPVFCQAGGSPRGRDFAASHADTIIASAQGPAEMKAFRDDIRSRMQGLGRDPDSCKILFIVNPTVGATDAEAQAIRERLNAPEVRKLRAEAALGHLSALTENDFSGFDLDQPQRSPKYVVGLHQNGHRRTDAG